MDRQQAEQEVALVRVRMETDSLEVSHRAKGSHDWVKCMVAFVAGLTVAVAVSIILHYFIFTPSYNQDVQDVPDVQDVQAAPAPCGSIRSYKLQKTAVQDQYDIFTADKGATYHIFGWVKLPNVTTETFFLEQFRDSWGNIDKFKPHTTEVVLHNEVKLADNTKVSLKFKSAYIDSLFLVYESDCAATNVTFTNCWQYRQESEDARLIHV